MNMTPPSPLVWPLLALMAWTLAVLLVIAWRRLRALWRGQVSWQDFRMGEAATVPERVTQANRNYMNLLELPLLFYASGLLALQTGHGADAALLALAWAYVALRVAHSLVHLSYNRVAHRFVAFVLSNFVWAAMLGRLLWLWQTGY